MCSIWLVKKKHQLHLTNYKLLGNNIVYLCLGNVGVNELLTTLIESVDIFSEHQSVEVKEEAERAERELVKWEQDEAYRASLEIDR